jgi:hypothetical protein
VKKRKERKRKILALQVHITHIFTILLWSNNALERPRIADLTQEYLHPQWADVGREYGVTVVKTEQYGWALVAERSFRPLEAICPYSSCICAAESDIDHQSDYKLQLVDGRFCDGNLIGKFANDYPSQDDFINSQWKVHPDNVVWLHVGACTTIARGDLVFVRFGPGFWRPKIEVLDNPACRIAIKEEIAWIDRKKNINH